MLSILKNGNPSMMLAAQTQVSLHKAGCRSFTSAIFNAFWSLVSQTINKVLESQNFSYFSRAIRRADKTALQFYQLADDCFKQFALHSTRQAIQWKANS